MNSRIISLTVHTTCRYLVNFTQRQMSPEPTGEEAGRVSGHQHLPETLTQFNTVSTLSLFTLPTAVHAPSIVCMCTRAVRKVSVHFEYHENRLRGVDIIWQSVRGDLTAQT